MGVLEIRQKAVDWMLDLARNDAHGYDQDDRWGEYGDYDCSSAVITAYQKAGVPVKAQGATYTGNMRKVFLQCGFVDVTNHINLSTGKGLLLGDVLLNEVHHTAMYVGDGLEAEASINEFGGAHGGQPGDQTGREILIRAYRNYPWDCVLRYVGNREDVKPSKESTAYVLNLNEIKEGSTGYSVVVLQAMLNIRGYTDKHGEALEVDGDFGPCTDSAVCNFQLAHRLGCDGIVGEKTWKALFEE